MNLLTEYKRDLWYDRYTRSWVAQLKDAEGNQVGDAEYTAHKPIEPEADFVARKTCLISKTWAPESFDDIKGKAHLYRTARLKATGCCVQLIGFDVRTGSFQIAGDNGWYNWRELDSYRL